MVRQTTYSRRQLRGTSVYLEHDDLEGLPVRQWRREWRTLMPPDDDALAKTLPDQFPTEPVCGMPKETHLLPPHSQAMLRAARTGEVYGKRKPDQEADADQDAAMWSKTRPAGKKGVHVAAWRKLPRKLEDGGQSLLAPRRQGTVVLPPPEALPSQWQEDVVMRATVRRVDAAGNSYEVVVTVEPGTSLDMLGGAIVSTTQVPRSSLQLLQPQTRPHGPLPKPWMKGKASFRRARAGLCKLTPTPAQRRSGLLRANLNAPMTRSPLALEMKLGDPSEQRAKATANDDNDLGMADEGNDGTSAAMGSRVACPQVKTEHGVEEREAETRPDKSTMGIAAHAIVATSGPIGPRQPAEAKSTEQAASVSVTPKDGAADAVVTMVHELLAKFGDHGAA